MKRNINNVSSCGTIQTWCRLFCLCLSNSCVFQLTGIRLLHLTGTSAQVLVTEAAKVIRTGAGGHAVGQRRQKEQPKEELAERRKE